MKPFRSPARFRVVLPVLFSLAVACVVVGCDANIAKDINAGFVDVGMGPLATTPGGSIPVGAASSDGQTPPSGLVDATFGGESLNLWPYTGTSFDGTPVDPVNLLFVGDADPVAIRDALLSLDGDRTAAGFPPVAPFNARWSDAIGDAQTNWVAGEGWTGSAIQLQLGDYAPLRVHLRLFRTGASFGSAGTWTVGAAHFEVLIPGTADHQVLSWELAEQVVLADLARSGLLDATTPLGTVAINAAPTFREIPPFIYNALPPELTGLVGGPAPPVSAGVGIGTDGSATVLHVTKRAAAAGRREQNFTIEYDQVVPRPFCADGPADWIHVKGPVTFQKSAANDGRGGYTFDSRYSGRLVATPVDISQNPPAPAGEPFEALVNEMQRGSVAAGGSALSALGRRLVPGDGGSEFVTQQLRVGSDGAKRYDVHTRCE